MQRCLLLASALVAAQASGWNNPGVANCTLHLFEQITDHFNFRLPSDANGTFTQRVFIYDKYWANGGAKKGPIFFYTGNEGPVEMFANWTGLMWENAQQFGALVVFAEHRYYGESTDMCPNFRQCLSYLTHEQAMADYIYLIEYLRSPNFQAALRAGQTRHSLPSLPKGSPMLDIPVILFGGSYGGQLSSWIRMTYPTHVQGAIAASAPIMGVPGLQPPFNPDWYWQIVSRTWSAAAGAAPNCAANVERFWPVFDALGKSEAGRAKLVQRLGLCGPLPDDAAVEAAKLTIIGNFDGMAMGNYPYPCSYILGDWEHFAPAFPVRLSCLHWQSPNMTEDELLTAMYETSQLGLNTTGSLQCIPVEPVIPDGRFTYQVCTEALPDSVPFYPTRGAPYDMFWPQTGWPYSRIDATCESVFGVTPRRDWIAIEHGGHDMIKMASNIVFSNGEFDPWRSGGVFYNNSARDVSSYFVAGGAHHLDLFFTNAADPPAAAEVRALEVAAIARWVAQFWAAREP